MRDLYRIGRVYRRVRLRLDTCGSIFCPAAWKPDGDSHLQDDLEPRTQRTVNEAMDISILSKGVDMRCSPRLGINMNSTSSRSYVSVPTGSNAHPGVVASICVEEIAN